jgi:hypothetical protein
MKKKRLLRQQEHAELFSAEIAELELERYKNARKGVWKLRRALLKTKKKKHSFFSIVQLMLQIGKEADAQNENGGGKKPGSKKLRDRLRRRSSVDSSDHASSITSAPSERSEASSQTDGKDMHDRRPSPRRILARFISMRLGVSSSKKKMRRCASV